MRALTTVGLLFFYLHWVVLFLVTLTINLIKLAWKWVTKNNIEKHVLSPLQATHSHVFKPLYDLITAQGFDLEIFSFQTADKASLEMWKLTREDKEITKPYPVLLMHGLLDCSASWFMHIDKSKSLPYMLAAQGYEVWLGNNRGNRISCKEDPKEQNFWDYNLDHMIDFDQPTLIQGVLQNSRKQKLIYIGHSQGSAQFILGLGVHSYLQDKIAAFIGLGTVVSLENIEDHIILKTLDKLKLIEIARFFGFKRILFLPDLLSRAFGVLVYNCRFYHCIVMFFVRLLCGNSLKNKISEPYFGVMLTHEPGGASTSNTLQWIQCYRHNGIMKRFDYGPQKNLEVYGSETPSTYSLCHLERLPFKSYLFRGKMDAVMNEQSFEKLVKRFAPEKVSTYDLEDYHHLEYLWSESAYQDLYPQIMKIADQTSQA